MKDYDLLISNLSSEGYFSKLKNGYPDDEEIERTNKIIETFNIKNGKELTELYLKTDVILLADIFEKFIKVSINEFGINPLYCVSLPGYTWECGLKHTNIKLQTMQDENMILLIENNIRGGISSVMGDRYVKSDANTKVLYIDANNLYGWAMCQSLPYDEIKFVNDTRYENGNEIQPNNLINLDTVLGVPDDSDYVIF